MNILELKNYIKDLHDDMEIAYFDQEFHDYIIPQKAEVRKERWYYYTWKNPAFEAGDKKDLLILD